MKRMITELFKMGNVFVKINFMISTMILFAHVYELGIK